MRRGDAREILVVQVPMKTAGAVTRRKESDSMRKYVAVILMLAAPAFGQIHRGNAGTCFSNFHNFNCIPIDGGQVYAFDMNNPATTDCITNHVPNNAAFTGSAAVGFQCGGPTIQATGMTVTNPGFAFLSPAPSLPNGWTISKAFISSAVATGISGPTNFNYPSATTTQYLSYAGANVAIGYSPGSSLFAQGFQSTSTPNANNTWQVNTGAYTSAVAGSAAVWYNNTPLAGSWVAGTGTSALPSVQVETDIGALHGNDNQWTGTIGYIVIHDHRINSSAQGFIYNAIYRAMQFRGVALPTP
jgi:hypothetical protein